MIALISPAKRMRSGRTKSKDGFTEPRFLEHTRHIATLMLQYNSKELEDIFKISPPLASELRHRFANFLDPDNNLLPAIESYDGVVYKHLKGEDGKLSNSSLEYLQQHVVISSLIYGVVRPLDLIKPYRMEGFVRLAGSDERVDRYWRNIQTDQLISDINQAGGVLLYLASKEEQNAFHWKKVTQSVRVIEFEFLVPKGDKLRQVVVYTKMARGEMIRYMMRNSTQSQEELRSFSWGGYTYNDKLSTQNKWVWVMNS